MGVFLNLHTSVVRLAYVNQNTRVSSSVKRERERVNERESVLGP